MSDENVDVVRRQFEATNAGDFARAMSYYADDVVLVVDRDAFLESGTFEGREAVGAWFGDWISTFETHRLEIEDARDLGHVVFLSATISGRGRTSGAQVRGRTGYLYTVTKGKIVRVELHRSPEAALDAARESAGK